jgi:hypothetical protein
MLGIVPGSEVEFCLAADGNIVLTRTDEKPPASPFQRLRGHAGEGLDWVAVMALTRGDT